MAAGTLLIELMTLQIAIKLTLQVSDLQPMTLQVACRYRRRGYHVATVVVAQINVQQRPKGSMFKHELYSIKHKIQLLDQSNLTETKAWS